MPTFLIIIFTVLVGYPLVQLISALLVRSMRRELELLVREIKQDPRYVASDLTILDWSMNMGPPSAVTAILLPIFSPLALLAWTIDILKGKFELNIEELERSAKLEFQAVIELHTPGGSKSPIWNDERFHRAHHLTTEIDVRRFPITMLVTMIVSLPFLMVALVAQGIRMSVSSFFNQSTKRALLSARLAWTGIGSR